KPTDAPQSVHLILLPEVEEQVLRMIEDITPVQFDDIIPEGEAMQIGPAWIWERLMDIRGDGLVLLEAIKNQGVKNSLDVEAVFKVPADKPGLKTFIEQYLPELEDLLSVGYARVEEGDVPKDKFVGIELLDITQVSGSLCI
ncbi:MAG: hypothetical protein QF689_12060, partial [Candidatus Latescibacteria bacterium]|nr:hypothetical protein [Candidatus Latescibacterota bacterium]